MTHYTSGLAWGSYYAVVTISTGLGAISIPVTLNVGYLSGLTLSPSMMAFQYAWNTQTYSWGQSSVLAVSGALTGSGFTATSSTSWLLVNGATSASGIIGSNVTISVNALALGSPPVPYTSTGYVYFYSNGLTGTLPVSLTVLGTPTSSNSSLTFYATNAASPVAPQYITVTGYGSYFTAVNRNTGTTNWLAASPASGTVVGSTSVGIRVNPAGLAPGTYSGSVQVYLGGSIYIQGIAVTMTVGGTPAPTPVFSISTHSMIFSYQLGGSVPSPQTLQANTDAGSSAFSVSSNAAWITVTPGAGTTPAAVSISVNPAGLGIGTQTGTVYVTAPGAVNGTHTVSIKLEITSPPSLAMNTNALAFSYRMGGPVPDSQAVHLTCTGGTVSFTISTLDEDWFSVRQSGTATPATLTFSVNPASLPVGRHLGRVIIDAGTATHTIALSLVVMGELPTIRGIYNGASFQQGAIAPGEVVTLSGTSLGPETPSKMTVTNNLVGTTLAGTRVLIGGIPAPLMHVDQTQVTAMVPYAIAGRSSTIVQLERDGERSNCLTIEVAVTAPGVFTLNGSGTGPGAVVNDDGSINSSVNPAETGSIVSVYATGEGQTLPFGIDGQMASDVTALPKPVLPVSATIGGIAADILYAGAAPHAVAGMLQVNMRVPQNAESGDVVLTIGDKSSQAGVTIAVR